MSCVRLPRRVGRPDTESWRLNARYVRYCVVALALSLTGHVLYLMFGPAPEAKPYDMQKPVIIIFDPPEVPVIEPLPPAIDPPRLPVEVETSDTEVHEVEEIPDSRYRPGTRYRPHAPEPEVEFVAFDTPPEVIRLVRPEYPELARLAYAEGDVIVQITIDETGRVTRAVILRTNAIESLQNAALEAARSSLFKPAMQRDQQVRAIIVVPFHFRLGEGPARGR